jgi:hypothetical protein
VNVPLIVSGSLAILGAALHGAGGEILVVRQLSPGMLPVVSENSTHAFQAARW